MYSDNKGTKNMGAIIGINEMSPWLCEYCDIKFESVSTVEYYDLHL
jgi:hypothetical protein